MRHKKKGSSLNRTSSHRRMLLSNLISSLFSHERIRTTTAKAKQARPLAEKMITFAKRGDLHARRQVLRVIRDKDIVAKLFTTLSERFKQRPGGYTRILKMGNRPGDNAPMALFELMPDEVITKPGKKKRRSRRPKKKPAAEQQAVEQAEAGQTVSEEAAEVQEPAEEKAEAAATVVEEAAEEQAGAGEAEKKEDQEGEEEEKKKEE